MTSSSKCADIACGANLGAGDQGRLQDCQLLPRMPAAGRSTTFDLAAAKTPRSGAPAQRRRVHRRIPQSLRVAVEHRYGDRGAGHVEGCDVGTSLTAIMRRPSTTPSSSLVLLLIAGFSKSWYSKLFGSRPYGARTERGKPGL
jgi:hypothetical protein